jgi:hypothetical protein
MSWPDSVALGKPSSTRVVVSCPQATVAALYGIARTGGEITKVPDVPAPQPAERAGAADGAERAMITGAQIKAAPRAGLSVTLLSKIEDAPRQTNSVLEF